VPVSSWPAHGQPALAGARGHRALVLGHVDREGAADRQRGAPGGLQAVEGGVDVGGVEAAGRVEERVLGVQRAPRRELEVADLRALAGEAQLGLGADADHADARDVALEQRVHRLRGRVGDELDPVAVRAEVVEQHPQHLGDALGDTRGGGVAGRHDGVRAQLERVDGERHRLGERPADVDANPDAAGRDPQRLLCRARGVVVGGPAVRSHAVAVSATRRRRRAGCQANTYSAPST
jgi:hypothetical protein